MSLHAMSQFSTKMCRLIVENIILLNPTNMNSELVKKSKDINVVYSS